MASAHHVTCIRIAIALLKDRNGVIDVDLPVTGSLDDPQFKLGPLIWKAVLNLMTKIATAPFAAGRWPIDERLTNIICRRSRLPTRS